MIPRRLGGSRFIGLMDEADIHPRSAEYVRRAKAISYQ
jgi:hypothetical protein